MVASACRRRIAKLEGEPGDDARAQVYAIREAWSILGDEKLRAGYDASLAVQAPGAAVTPAAMAAEISPDSVARTLLKPRQLLPGHWERYRKLVFLMVVVGLFALSTAWNHSARVAAQKRVQAAEYEAEHGEPPPDPRQAAKVEEAKAAEPFSAEKFEREMRERETQLKAQVEKEQAAKDDEFRAKLQQENDPYAGRRRPRYR